MAMEGYQPFEVSASMCRMVFVALPDGMQLIVPHFNILRVSSPVVSRYATTGRPSCPMAMEGYQPFVVSASMCWMVFVTLPDGMQLTVPHFNILRVYPVWS